MKKIVLFLLLPLMIGLSACQHSLKTDKIAETILETERARIPMMLKEIPYIDSMTMDSCRIYIETEPMAAFLYSAWYDKDSAMFMIVQVEDIINNEGQIEWNCIWGQAKIDYEIEKTRSYEHPYIK